MPKYPFFAESLFMYVLSSFHFCNNSMITILFVVLMLSLP